MKVLITVFMTTFLFGCSSTKKFDTNNFYSGLSYRNKLIVQYTDSAASSMQRGRSDSTKYWFNVALNVDSILFKQKIKQL